MTSLPSERPSYLQDGPEQAPLTILLAHGAGAGMDTPFMNHIATGIARHGFQVLRFEFPYMQQMKALGKRRAPNSAAILRSHFEERIAELGDPQKLIIGGKSMGGRIASTILDSSGVRGGICLGYPFHPPGKPVKLRTEHLKPLQTPLLILQGERDPFGTREDVANYTLSKSIEISWLPDGEHSFKARKASGHTTSGNWDLAVQRTVKFLNRVLR